MKENKLNRVVFAWLLSVIFIVPHITRTIHIYQKEPCENTCSHNDNNHTHTHDCNTCPVCQFVMASFTEADLFASDTLLTTFSKPVYIWYNENSYTTLTYANHLRAPPLS